MSAENDKTEIAGLEISTTKLPPRKALRIGAQLLKFAIPVMREMGDDAELDEAAVNKIGASVFASLDEDQLDELLCKLLVATVVKRPDGKGKTAKFELHDPAAIDAAFAGKLGAMIECAKWVMGFNFADFFAEGSATPLAAGADS